MGRTGDSLLNQFPPRSGGGSPLREELLVGRKRGGPWVEMIVVVVVVVCLLLLLSLSSSLNVITTNRVIIVEPDGPRRMTLAWGFSCILQKVSFKCKENDWASNWVFCCRGSRLRILSKNQDRSFCIFAVLIIAQGFS